MLRLAASPICIVATCLFGCSQQASAPSYGPRHRLTDDEIAAYAAKFSEDSLQRPAEIIGIHNDTRVVAEIRYFDDGESWVGIVHYDVEPGEGCTRAGGLVRREEVPVAAASIEEPFCVPKVLVDRKIPGKLQLRGF